MLPYQPGKKLIYANLEMSIRATIEIQDLFYLAGGISESIVKGVYVPYGAANLAAGLVNQANPGTDDLVSMGADPAHSGANGFSFDGVNDYLKVSNFLIDGDWSVLMKIANQSDGGYYMGCNDGNEFGIGGDGAGNLVLSNGTALSGVLSGTSGAAIAGTKAYRNGTALAGTFTPLSAPLTDVCYIGGMNFEGALDFIVAFDLLWMVVYSGTLTEAQVAAVYAAAPV